MERRRLVRNHSRRLLAGIGVRVAVRGALPTASQPVLLIANHVSWIDAYALNAVFPARFVAKSEVLRWPFVGTIADRCGTFFIVRGSFRSAYRVKDALAEALRAGESTAAFPEGTTTNGDRLLDFRAAMLQAAVDAGIAVQPVAIRYRGAGGAPTTAAGYVDDMSLIDSLRRLVREPAVIAELIFLPRIDAERADRRHLAFAARESIAGALGLVPSRTRESIAA